MYNLIPIFNHLALGPLALSPFLGLLLRFKIFKCIYAIFGINFPIHVVNPTLPDCNQPRRYSTHPTSLHPFSLSITSLFHFMLKINLFHKSFHHLVGWYSNGLPSRTFEPSLIYLVVQQSWRTISVVNSDQWTRLWWWPRTLSAKNKHGIA